MDFVTKDKYNVCFLLGLNNKEEGVIEDENPHLISQKMHLVFCHNQNMLTVVFIRIKMNMELIMGPRRKNHGLR